MFETILAFIAFGLLGFIIAWVADTYPEEFDHDN